MEMDIWEIEKVLRERFKFHDTLYKRFEEEGRKLETAIQYNLREECQNIARQLLGYYL
jgi:hypothetical protein